MTIAIENGKRNQRARWPTPDELLCLAASPVFAVMALHATKAEMADPICAAMKGPLPLDGMTFMYLLMCLFHLPPWMKLRSASHAQSPNPQSKETDQ
ncbi:MAG: hypothetical protein CMI62_09690 [Parvibaculum sp.]|jgi:hypothetical protein|uniref:hypothetical protein n=1 Tax=Parvibaculum sp. TaxID=2024848 RepID=UPI000C5408A8|nr:hypothetical protein [Parvibaculum sp.]MAU60985.1 hypothetical protein [Parvibaculum sp.]|tara:strand:- start:3676 stop:3966 length:291 start_codon:yes stop_codon:yes gene_type:complete